MVTEDSDSVVVDAFAADDIPAAERLARMPTNSDRGDTANTEELHAWMNRLDARMDSDTAPAAGSRPRKFGLSTFGTEPIGPNSWTLNSPRSLEICARTGIIPESLRPQPFSSFQQEAKGGLVPFEVAQMRCRSVENCRLKNLHTLRQMWFDENDRAAAGSAPPGRAPSFSSAIKQRRQKEERLQSSERHRERIFVKKRVKQAADYAEAARKYDESSACAKAAGNQEAERKRQEKANAVKMLEMRRRATAVREERETAAKYAALMAQELQEREDMRLAAIQDLYSAREREAAMKEAAEMREMQQLQHQHELQMKAAERQKQMQEQDMKRRQRFDETLATKKAVNKRKAEEGAARVLAARTQVAMQQQKIKDDFEYKQNRQDEANRLKIERSKVEAAHNRQACKGKQRRNRERINAVKKREIDWVKDLVEKRTTRQGLLEENQKQRKWQSTIMKEELDLKRQRKKSLVQQWKRANEHKTVILAQQQDKEDKRLEQVKHFEKKLLHDRQTRANKMKWDRDDLNTNLLSVQVTKDYARLQKLKPLDSQHSMRQTLPEGVLQTVVARADKRAAAAEMDLQMSSTISGVGAMQVSLE